MTSQQMTAELLTGAIRSLSADVNIHPAFRAGLSSSPALDRACAAIAASAPRIAFYRHHSVKLGAEVILTDLANGNNNTYRRALSAPPGSVARRQAALATAWRDRFGTLAKLPTRRTRAMQRSMKREGGDL